MKGFKAKREAKRIDKLRCERGTHTFIQGSAFDGFYFKQCSACPTKEFTTREEWEQLPEE